MRYDHRQAGLNELPRKLIAPNLSPASAAAAASQDNTFFHRFASPIPEVLSPTKSSTSDIITIPLKDETPQVEYFNPSMSDAKQMLFDRYLGDQTQRFNAMRNRLKMKRDMSDDAISSNYPNSSYSTFRDMTCSSIASSTFGAGESLGGIYPSDSFEYDNSDDRMRIKLMNQTWSNPKSAALYNKLKSLSESEDEEDLAEYVFGGLNRLKNASSRSLDASGAESCATVKYNEFVGAADSAGNSTIKSHITDLYSHDYMARARNFGDVVKVKKPGHHIGPVRNPECKCDHCRRWMAERETTRNRALSTGDLPPTARLDRWKKGENVD